MTKRSRKNGEVEHYVSTLKDDHADMCFAAAKPTARQIQLLPTFNAAVRGNRQIGRKALVAIVQARDLTNLQRLKDKVYRAKDGVIQSIDGEYHASYSLIVPLLAQLERKNKGSRVAVEVDQQNRFFRAFVAFGIAVQSQKYNVPVLGFDGTHSKNSKYNGVLLTLINRDGIGQNVTLATAFVPVENEDNIVWFLYHSIDAGINFTNVPVFCDRGKIRAAIKTVMRLIICEIHIHV